MSSTTAQFFKSRNRKTVWLKEALDAEGNVIAVPCEEGDPEAVAFELARVNGDQIGRECMQALLAEDEYVRFANWYAAQSQKDLTTMKAQTAKADAPSPWPDTPPDKSEAYQAHMLALGRTLRRAVLRAGMKSPTFAEIGEDLGPFEEALFVQIRTYGRALSTTDDSF